MAYCVEYQQQIVPLPPGESYVGRGLECRVRFNDPGVSRVHLRLVMQDELLTAEDAGSTNGSWLNEQKLEGVRTLTEGDVLRIGCCSFRIAREEQKADVVVDSTGGLSAETTAVVEVPPQQFLSGAQVAGQAAATTSAVALSNESNTQGPKAIARARGGAPTPPFPLRATSLQEWMASARSKTQKIHHCARCRSPVSFSVTTCPRCAFQWPKGHPSSPTQPIDVADADRRRETRWRVELPVLYSSAELVLHGMVRDLSFSGMYIMTDLLDPVGTLCTIELLPDGQGAMMVSGMVRHVVAKAAGSGGRPPGMGVKFTAVPDPVHYWLKDFIGRLAAAVPAAEDLSVSTSDT